MYYIQPLDDFLVTFATDYYSVHTESVQCGGRRNLNGSMNTLSKTIAFLDKSEEA